MLEKQAQLIIRHKAAAFKKLLSPAPVIVGLSGGADSTLALLVAKALQELDAEFKVTAVHCIHGLDADDPIWLEHCTALCKRLGIELQTLKLNIVYANRISPEDASRKERYRALLSKLPSSGYLFLGHQKDDVVEGFLLALKRGSGPLGLANMKTITQDCRGTIVRPLLDLRKHEIEEILRAIGCDFVFDVSNTYLKFERNFIRLKVLPVLRGRFAGIDEAIYRSSRLCAFEHDLAERFLDDLFSSHYVKEQQALNLEGVDLDDEALAVCLLRKFLSLYTSLPPDFSIVKESLALMRADSDQKGQIQLENYVIRRFRNRLYVLKDSICPKAARAELVFKEDKVSEVLTLGDFSYSLKKVIASDLKQHRAAFNFAGSKGDFVLLNFQAAGSLRLKPWQRAHSRELKKLMAFYEVPVWYRRAMPLVTDPKGEILSAGSVFSCIKPDPKLPCYVLEVWDLRNNRNLVF